MTPKPSSLVVKTLFLSHIHTLLDFVPTSKPDMLRNKMKKQAAEAAAPTVLDGATAKASGPTKSSESEGGTTTSILGVGGKAIGGGKKRVGVQRTAGELRIQKDITELDGGSVAETGKKISPSSILKYAKPFYGDD
jgi:hypothetical protein